VKGHNITIIDEDIEAVRLREGVEFVLEIFTILNILLKTKDGPLLEVYWLANNLAQNVGVVKDLLSTWASSTNWQN